jgi:predicted nucleic acid-binding protein
MIGTDRFVGRKLYLDANVFINALEEFPRYVQVCLALLQGIERKEFRACTSELTLAETLARPMRENRFELARIYEEILQNDDSLSLVPVSRSVLVASARLRAITGSHLPDSIHLATAVAAKCNYIITGDKSFKTTPEVALMTLDEMLV